MIDQFHASGPGYRSGTVALTLVVLLAGLSGLVRANDFEAYGIGATLAPVAASRIRLLTERVTLTELADDWQAEAVYVFHNPTGEAITTVFAFPEGCGPQGDDGDDGRYQNPEFRDLKTWVRGAPTPTRLLTAVPWTGIDLCLGRVHAFDIVFAADERIEVRHRYRFSTAAGIGFQEVNYLTRTGALWDGPIGAVEFIVAPRTVPTAISWPEGLDLVGFEEQLGEGGRQIAYRLAAKDWRPRLDFQANLFARPDLGGFMAVNGVTLPCPDPSAVVERTAEENNPITALSDGALALCRNLPYARHGYPFRRAELRDAFYRNIPVPGGQDGDTFGKGAGLRIGTPNPFYSDALLDADDRAYLAAIAAEQARRAGQAASGH